MDKRFVIKNMTLHRPFYTPFVPDLKVKQTKKSVPQAEILNLSSNVGIHALLKGGINIK